MGKARLEEGMEGEGRAPGALFCDTNVLVRFLTGKPRSQALAARDALQAAGDGFATLILTDLVVAELAYVLTGPAGLTVQEAASRIEALVDLPGIESADDAIIRDTLAIWTAQNLDFADSYLAALARGTRGTGVLSFDRDLDGIEGTSRIDPSYFTRPRRTSGDRPLPTGPLR